MNKYPLDYALYVSVEATEAMAIILVFKQFTSNSAIYTQWMVVIAGALEWQQTASQAKSL